MELTSEQKELIRDFETVKLGIKQLEANSTSCRSISSGCGIAWNTPAP